MSDKKGPKCITIFAFVLTIIAIGGHIAAIIRPWLPDNEALNQLISASLPNETLLTKTLPIISAGAAGLAGLIFLTDLIKNNTYAKGLGSIIILGAAGSLGYAVGFYLYKLIKASLDIVAYDWANAASSAAADSELIEILGITQQQIDDIQSNLGITDFQAEFETITGIWEAGITYGAFIGAGAVALDLIVFVFYFFIMLCCRK